MVLKKSSYYLILLQWFSQLVKTASYKQFFLFHKSFTNYIIENTIKTQVDIKLNNALSQNPTC